MLLFYRNMKHGVVILLLLLLAGAGNAAIYYVDSAAEAGGDGSYAAPFSTLAGVAAVAGDNDTIRLKQGSVFREDFIKDQVTGLTIEAYGDGSLPMPVLYGDKIVANASWSKTDGRTNVYQYQIEQTVNDAYLQVWEDGDTLQIVVDVATCDSTPGSYTLDDVTLDSDIGTRTFYLHASDSSDVTANGKVYSITDPTRNGILWVGSGSTLKYLAAGRQGSVKGALVCAGLMMGCTVFQSAHHGAQMGSGEFRDCIAWHPANDSRGNCILMEFYASDGTGKDCIYRNCVAIGPGSGASQAVDGLSGHNMGEGTYYRSISTYDCAVVGTTGISQRADSLRLERVRVVGSGISAHASSASGGDIVDCWVEASVGNPATYPISGSGPIRIDGLRLSGSYTYGIYNLTSLAVSRSVFYGTKSAAPVQYGLYLSGTPTAATSGCIFQYTALDSYHYWLPDHSNLTSSSNVFTTTGKWIATNTYTTLAALQAGTGLESGSIEADPQFVDPANGNFTPQNAAVLALPVGLDADSLAVTYTPIPTEEEILQFDWPGSIGGSTTHSGIFGGSVLR